MANNDPPDVTLQWPDRTRDTGGMHKQHMDRPVWPTGREGTEQASKSAGADRNLLRLRLPATRSEEPVATRGTGSLSTEGEASAPGRGPDVAQLAAEVERVRAEVSRLRQRIDDLERKQHGDDERD